MILPIVGEGVDLFSVPGVTSGADTAVMLSPSLFSRMLMRGVIVGLD